MSDNTVQIVPAETATTYSSSLPARLTFWRVVKSEWLKQWTLKTTVITLAAMLLLTIAFGLIAAMAATGAVQTPDGGRGGGFSRDGSPLSTVLAGASFAVLIICVLGVLAGAREFSSGMIRMTLSAVPSRLPVLWAKVLVFSAAVIPVAAIGVFIAFLGGTALLTNAGVASASLSDPDVPRVLLGTVGYLLGLGIMGLALGVLLRSIGGALGALIGGILFVPTLAQALLPDSWGSVLKYLPAQAAQAVTSTSSSPLLGELLSPTAGALVFSAWVIASLAGAAIVLKRRDV